MGLRSCFRLGRGRLGEVERAELVALASRAALAALVDGYGTSADAARRRA